jgi:flagellar hook-associated protein 2
VIGSVAGTSGNAYSCLSDIGIGFDRQGGLEVDADQLQAAVAADPEAVSALFTGDNGVAERMSEALDDYTNSSDGLVTYKIESLEDKLERYQEDLEQAEEDVENYLDRLVQKYTAMENAILEYQSMQDQIDSLNDTFDAMYKG